MGSAKVWMYLIGVCWQENVGWTFKLVFSGVYGASSAVSTGGPSRPPSQSSPGARRRTMTETGRATGMGARPLQQQQQVTLHQQPRSAKCRRGKWMCWKEDVSAFSEQFTQNRWESFLWVLDVSNSHSRYVISIPMWHLWWCQTFLLSFLLIQWIYSIHTCCKLIIRKRMCAACMSVFSSDTEREKNCLKSLSFLNDAHTETMGRRSD